jgi:hypothetical protein
MAILLDSYTGCFRLHFSSALALVEPIEPRDDRRIAQEVHPSFTLKEPPPCVNYRTSRRFGPVHWCELGFASSAWLCNHLTQRLGQLEGSFSF